MRRYIDEYLDESFNAYDKIKTSVQNHHKRGLSIDSIAREIEEEFYVFRDNEEHDWNRQVVYNIINNKPTVNRFTKTVWY